MRKEITKIYDTDTGMIEVANHPRESSQYKTVALYYSPEADELFLYIDFSNGNQEIIPVGDEEISDWWENNSYGGNMGELADAMLAKKQLHSCLG